MKKFWKKKSVSRVEMFEACELNMRSLTREEREYIVLRFTETLKGLAFMTIEQNIRIAMTELSGRLISAKENIYINFTWGICGNDLLAWIGEYRKKKEEMEVRS